MRRPSLVPVALGAIFLLAATIAAVALSPRPSQETIPLPETVAGLPRTEVKTGRAAVEQVERLHGETLPLTEAAYARYGSRGEATLWIAGTSADRQAAALVESMTRAIAAGGSPFSPPRPEAADGRTVYRLTGMGQDHAYFQAGRLVVWLAAEPAIAATALAEVLEVYP